MNYELLCEVKTSSNEITYRKENCHDISSVAQEDIQCTACGEQLVISKTQRCYINRVVGTLQCQICYERCEAKKPWELSNRLHFCIMCGKSSVEIQKCATKDCSYSSCQSCILRNKSETFVTKNRKWNCFICRIQQLYSRRAVAAAVMASLSEKSCDRPINIMASKGNINNKNTSIKGKNKNGVNKQNTIHSSDSESSDDTSERNIFRKKIATEKSLTSTTSSISKAKKLKGHLSSNHVDLWNKSYIEERQEYNNTQLSTNNSQSSRNRHDTIEDNTQQIKTRKLNEKMKKITRHIKENNSNKNCISSSTSRSNGSNSNNIYNTLGLLSRENSCSSSDKEFSRYKIIPSYVPLQRILDIDKDYTTSPIQSPSIQQSSPILSKQDAFILKNNVHKFFQNMKNCVKKMESDIELIEKKYHYKEKLKIDDATRIMVGCTNMIRDLKRQVRNNEDQVINRYDTWCKRAKIKNIFINKSYAMNDTPNRYKKNIEKSTVIESSGSDSDQTLKNNSIHEVKSTEEATRKNTIVIGKSNCEGQSPNEISDFDEREIFSANESSNPLSPTIDKSITNRDKTIISTEDNKARNKLPDKNIINGINNNRELNENINNHSDNEIVENSKKNSSNCVVDRTTADNPTNSSEEIPQRSSTPQSILNSSIDNNDSQYSIDMFQDESENEANNEKKLSSDTSIKSRSKSPIEKTSSEKENITNGNHIDEEKTESKEMVACGSSSSDTETIILKRRNKKFQNITSSDNKIENKREPYHNIQSSPLNVNSIDEENSKPNKMTLYSSNSSSDTATIITKPSTKQSQLMISSDDEMESERRSSLHIESPPHSISDSQSQQQKKSSKTITVEEEFREDENSNEKNSKRKSSKTKMKSLNRSDEYSMINDSFIDKDDVDEEQTKKALLDSSSDSDHETSINTSNDHRNSFLDNDESIDNEDLIKNKSAEESSKSLELSINSQLPPLKSKREKFVVSNNNHYKCDSKLRMIPEIELTRLGKNILVQHSLALKLSKEYLENKLVKSLMSIDNIEKKKKKKSHSADALSSSEDGETSTKRPVKLKRKEKQLQDTLLDHLNKATESNEENDNNSGGDDDDSSDETSNKNFEDNASVTENFTSNADKLYKTALLESSHSEADDDGLQNIEENDVATDTDNINDNKDKSEEKHNRNEHIEFTDEDLLEKKRKKEKNKWKRSKVLTVNFSDTDSEAENRKIEKKLSQNKDISKNSDDTNNTGEDSECPTDTSPMKKIRTRRRRLASDSDIKITDDSDTDVTVENKNVKKVKLNNESDDGKKSKKRRKKSDNSTDSSTSIEVRKSKPKRKRIRAVADDSDSDSGNEQNSFHSSQKSGRKNIRKVLKNNKVAEDTKQAGKLEEERLRRMAERQKLYNEMYEARLANEEKVDKLVLDFDEESKEVLLSVDENLVKRLKPHQARGIKFMWDASFESLERAKTTSGSGCILAHCMGLGKSFQVVTLSHTLLSNTEKTQVNTILIVAPLSTVLNWVNEFKIWLSEVENGDDIEIYEMTKCKTTYERKYQLESWIRTGGILIIGYEMFRNLTNTSKKVKKNVRESILKCLIDPGADLVICDEGHLLKNEDSAISKAMRRIRTLRRIVLTGTPLQNNLIEYHCMVQFVKPNLLGTKKEFLNRFANPIQNGQFDDSTEYDVKVMKKRAHVLHKMLEGSVQRFDYSVLMPFLPPKQEYVILARLTPVQIKLYQHYLEKMARQHVRVGSTLFADFQALQRIWTHPSVVKSYTEKMIEKRREADTDSEGSLKDFIDDGSDVESSSQSSSNNDSDVVHLDSSDDEKRNKRGSRANPNNEPIAEVETERKEEWWSEFVEPDDIHDMRVSAKLLLLFDIIKECEAIGDKVLVFSQSLYSLTLIENFLGMIDDETQKGNELESLGNHTGNWQAGLDYFRFDGQTSADNRSHWVKLFNKPSNTRARLFLISTRAGGLGINLTAANRVVIFDASWNPSHDVQSIFRIYRFGQKKPCYVYRLLAAGTMEEKIYNRQVTKLSLSCRVVDEQQIERHFSNNDLAELYTFEPPNTEPSQLALPKDRMIAEIFLRHKNLVETYHEHDSLLENIAGEELDDEERKQAWLEYEQEKAGKQPMSMQPNYLQQQHMLMMQQYNSQMMNNLNMTELNIQGEFANLLQFIRKDYPNLPEATQRDMAIRTLTNMYSYVENQVTTNLNTAVSIGNFNNPTATLANALAQQEYARQHSTVNKYQQQQQQQQIQYAQKFGNNIGNVNAARATPATSRDNDIVEVPSSSSRSNATLPANSSTKSQEE